MTLLGAYYRAYFVQAGLLPSTGCDGAADAHIRADVDQRTRETGRALAEGLFPGCRVDVHSLPGDRTDPLFHPVAAGVGAAESALARAAVLGRVGGNPSALVDVYRPAFDSLREVLFGCKPGGSCAAEHQSGKQGLLALPSAVDASKDNLVELRGPIRDASTLAEDFLLEYANGMAGKDLGWGRLNERNLREVMSFHTAYADLLRRTSYIARAQGSNPMSHILKSMEQAVNNRAAVGSLGKPGDRLVILAGHDANISNIAGMLGISWLLEGYQRDDTPPGGALVFELWQEAGEARYSVHTYYTAPTLRQMREALPLTLASPPAVAPVFLPGCSGADQKMSCTWTAFRRTVSNAIDTRFVLQ